MGDCMPPMFTFRDPDGNPSGWSSGADSVLRVEVPADQVHGDVDEGFGPVADAFRRNFAGRSEIGAACAVYSDGEGGATCGAATATA